MKGLTAIVTGAAGGVGTEVVRLLIERGANVVAEDINPAVEELAGDRVATLVADVTDAATGPTAVALAQERFGAVDILVNNAARFAFKPALETSDEEWDELMVLNVRSMFMHCKGVLPTMSERGGSIVNMASISGLTGASGQLLYSVTKGAIIQLTRVLAIEFAPRVRVNAVAPGGIETEFFKAALAGIPDPDGAAAAHAAAHPLGRFAQASEIAEVVVFLASPAASYVTGSIFAADGGFTAQ